MFSNTPRYHENLQVFSTQLCETVLHAHDPAESPEAGKLSNVILSYFTNRRGLKKVPLN